MTGRVRCGHSTRYDGREVPCERAKGHSGYCDGAWYPGAEEDAALATRSSPAEDAAPSHRLNAHEIAVLRAWTAGIHRDSRELVERVIDEAERSRFALNEIAVHLEGLQHVRRLTAPEQAILEQAREGLR